MFADSVPAERSRRMCALTMPSSLSKGNPSVTARNGIPSGQKSESDGWWFLSPSIEAMTAKQGLGDVSPGRCTRSFGSGGSFGDALRGARVNAAEEVGDLPTTIVRCSFQ